MVLAEPNLLGQSVCPVLAPLVAYAQVGIEAALDPDHELLESANFCIGQIGHRLLVHGADQRRHVRRKATPARRQTNDAPPAVGVGLRYRHQARAFEQTDRDDGRRTLTPDPPGELADRQSVIFPQLAQISPLADCNPSGDGRYVHGVLPGLGELADMIA